MHFLRLICIKEKNQGTIYYASKVFYSLSLPFRVLFINGYCIAAAYLGEVYIFFYIRRILLRNSTLCSCSVKDASYPAYVW